MSSSCELVTIEYLGGSKTMPGFMWTDAVAERDSIREQLAAAERLLDSRAGKLLKKGKTFIAVAVDEPQFSFMYDLIRKHEKHKGRWTVEDEAAFNTAMDEFNALLAAKTGGANE